MKKITRAIRNGLLIGIALLFLFSIPLAVTYAQSVRKERRMQTNLTPSAGLTETQVRTAPLILTGLVNGALNDAVSGSLDQSNWFMPDKGIIYMKGKPGLNTVYLSYENRLVSKQIELVNGFESRTVLDAGLAPEIPDLLILESSGSVDYSFIFPVKNANSIILENAPDGVTFRIIEGQFEISVPSKHLRKSFISFSIQSINQYGAAKTYVGIAIPNPGPLTEIRTVEDFSAMRNNLSGNYRLMNDLDFSSIDDWVPIGTSDFPFSGIFDGNGFEINGFHLIDSAYDRGSFSLLGICKNAIIRNTIIREPDIEVQNMGSGYECFAALANDLNQSLSEHNAVIKGKIIAGNGGASGIHCGIGNSIFLDLFNSADVFSSFREKIMRNTGGIVGGGFGYLTRCANEGVISGRHLTGGIVGYGANITLSHCINSGRIYGQPLVGEFPPGAIMQTADAGTVRSSLFLRGSAERGGTLFGLGMINGLYLIEPDQLQNPASLALLGSFEGESAQWEFSRENAKGPIPKGIFSRMEVKDE